jgi:hypothetical protein
MPNPSQKLPHHPQNAVCIKGQCCAAVDAGATARAAPLEQDRISLIRSCSTYLPLERVIHVSGDSAPDDHALVIA